MIKEEDVLEILKICVKVYYKINKESGDAEYGIQNFRTNWN